MVTGETPVKPMVPFPFSSTVMRGLFWALSVAGRASKVAAATANIQVMDKLDCFFMRRVGVG